MSSFCDFYIIFYPILKKTRQIKKTQLHLIHNFLYFSALKHKEELKKA